MRSARTVEHPTYTHRLVADFPFDVPNDLRDRLASVIDAEGKIPRALEALGPLAGRDVILVDGDAGLRARQLAALGARLVVLAPEGAVGRAALPIKDAAGRPVSVQTGTATDTGLPGASADVLVACWSSFRGPEPDQLDEAQRVLRPGGRLLVLHDYGRDDVSELRAPDLPEYTSWGRRSGPFLAGGFKIRVVHAWWSFDSLEEGRALLRDVFGAPGEALADRMRRPRLSYNVAVYHRTFAGDAA